jgi:hypothetical protein
MPICHSCGEPFDWGWDAQAQRWLPLEPIATHEGLDRTFVDENEVLRADHRDRHQEGQSGVNVTRLQKKVPAETADEKEKPRRRRRPA